MFSGFYLTNQGAALLAKVQAGQTQLNITKGQAGSGALPVNETQAGRTALVTPILDLPISKKTVSGQTITVLLQFTNKDLAAAFDWKELGLFATDPTLGEILYAYANCGTDADPIPAPSTSLTEFVFAMVATIGNATNVSVVIDESLVYAMLSDITARSISSETEPAELSDGLIWHKPTGGIQRIRFGETWYYLWSGTGPIPLSFTPSAHKGTHAKGAADEITPASIGASASNHDHNLTYAKIPTTVLAVLLASAWTGTEAPFTQIVQFENVTANTDGILDVADDVTPDQYKAASIAQLHKSGQAAGSVTVKAFGDLPTIDIPIKLSFANNR